MAMPNDQRFRSRASLEDMQALLSAAITCQKTMLVLGLRGCGQQALDSVWKQAGKQARYLSQLHEIMEAAWLEIQAVIDGEG